MVSPQDSGIVLSVGIFEFRIAHAQDDRAPPADQAGQHRRQQVNPF